jgi:hypothetical protein
MGVKYARVTPSYSHVPYHLCAQLGGSLNPPGTIVIFFVRNAILTVLLIMAHCTIVRPVLEPVRAPDASRRGRTGICLNATTRECVRQGSISRLW